MIKKELDLNILKLVVKELASVSDEIVYVGGSTISLFITEPEVITIRETFDVDCVVEVSSREEYEKFSKKLRNLGFSEDIHGGVLCRFRKNELILDVMPTDEKILGFSNIWYNEGVKRSITKELAGIKNDSFLKYEIELFFSKNSLAPRIIGEANDVDLFQVIAEKGLGFVIVPEVAKNRLCQSGELIVLGELEELQTSVWGIIKKSYKGLGYNLLRKQI